jgi:hypothetical protein
MEHFWPVYESAAAVVATHPETLDSARLLTFFIVMHTAGALLFLQSL